MPYEKLTPLEESLLTERALRDYKHALFLSSQEDAGGPGGGWADGYKKLEALGWKRVEKESGHRTYVSMKKPLVLNVIEPKKGDIVQLSSDTWWIFARGSWREMTVEEQIQASL